MIGRLRLIGQNRACYSPEQVIGALQIPPQNAPLMVPVERDFELHERLEINLCWLHAGENITLNIRRQKRQRQGAPRIERGWRSGDGRHSAGIAFQHGMRPAQCTDKSAIRLCWRARSANNLPLATAHR